MNQSQTRITLHPKDTSPFVCTCGGEVFNKGFLLRRVSTLLGGSKQPVEWPNAVYCVKCGKAVPDFLPEEFRPVIEVEVVSEAQI